MHATDRTLTWTHRCAGALAVERILCVARFGNRTVNTFIQFGVELPCCGHFAGDIPILVHARCFN